MTVTAAPQPQPSSQATNSSSTSGSSTSAPVSRMGRRKQRIPQKTGLAGEGAGESLRGVVTLSLPSCSTTFRKSFSAKCRSGVNVDFDPLFCLRILRDNALRARSTRRFDVFQDISPLSSVRRDERVRHRDTDGGGGVRARLRFRARHS